MNDVTTENLLNGLICLESAFEDRHLTSDDFDEWRASIEDSDASEWEPSSTLEFNTLFNGKTGWIDDIVVSITASELLSLPNDTMLDHIIERAFESMDIFQHCHLNTPFNDSLHGACCDASQLFKELSDILDDRY